jgi:hypothetical protein
MAKPLISDDRQLDTKTRDYCGSERHERLVFSMSPTGTRTPASAEDVVEHLVLKQRDRAPGSFAMSAQKGYLVKVTVMWFKDTFKWEVRQGGKTVDTGIAIINELGEVDQTKEPDEQAPV